MKRRKWKPGQKALIVLEGLKGRPIGELCAEHEISQAQYYQWRDQLLANAAQAFEPAGTPQRQGRLERENARLCQCRLNFPQNCRSKFPQMRAMRNQPAG